MARTTVGHLAIGTSVDVSGLRAGLGATRRMVAKGARATVDAMRDAQKTMRRQTRRHYRRTLVRVRRFYRNYSRQIKRAALGLVGLAAAQAAVGVVVVRANLASIDASAKFADRIGANVTALTGYHHAAELTGNTQRNLDLGMQRMTRRIAEAAQGTGEAKGAIEELGLSAQALNAMRPDEQFIAIARAMEQVEGRSDQVRLSFKLFDAEGVGLLNTLDLGEQGLRAAVAEAERLGIAFDRVDAAQVEMANDAITRLRASASGVGRTLTVEVAPYVTVMADELRRAWVEGNQLASTIERISGSAGSGIAWVADGIKTVNLAVLAFRANAAEAMADFNGMLARARDIGNNILNFRLDGSLFGGASATTVGFDHTGATESRAAERRARNEAQRLRMQAIGLAAQTPGDDVRETIRRVQREARAVADASAARQGTGAMDPASLRAQGAAMAELAREAEALRSSLRTPEAVYQDEAMRFDNLLDRQLISVEEHAAAMARAADERDRAVERLMGGIGGGVDPLAELRAQAEAVRVAVATPRERFAAEVERLRVLRDKDLLEHELYVRAVRQAGGRLLTGLRETGEIGGGIRASDRVGDAGVGRASRVAFGVSNASGSRDAQEVRSPVMDQIKDMLERIITQGIDARLAG